ncbi:MAG: phage integrase N-terminal SAM-like domain-containing protein [Betaproteobacteria bacterium]
MIAIASHESSRPASTGYAAWVRSFVRISGPRHPRDMGAVEDQAFLGHLADTRRRSVSAHEQRNWGQTPISFR